MIITSSSGSGETVHTPTQNIINQCVATAGVFIGNFGLGMVLAWSSPALPDMVKETGGHFYNMTSEEQSWIGSIATLGALASSPVAGFTVEHVGRKGSMLLFTFPFIVGWLLIGFATNALMMHAGRFITGFCGGCFSLCAPLYVGETVSNSFRGMLMNTLQLAMVTGILFTYVLGTYVSWKMLTLISSGVPLLFLAFVPFIPESPMFLARRGQTEKCENALEWLHGPKYHRHRRESVAWGPEAEKPKITFRDLLNGEVLKPLMISLSLMVLEQASAFNVVIFYCVDIFSQTGSEDLDEYWESIAVAIVQVLATMLSIFLVDRTGRRPLLIFSELVMGLSFVAVGVFFYLKTGYVDKVPGWLGWVPLVSVLIFIIAFSIGIGPLSWTVMGEVLHPDVKGLCSAIATSFVWLSAFVVTKVYQTMVAHVGIAISFWIFASISLAGTFVVYLYVPETKGKSLEEIQEGFITTKKKTTAEASVIA